MEKRLPLAVGTVLQNRYRIARQLGHGGFGAVYEAVDDELNLSFALKETFYAADEDLRAAFRREARLLASLSHEAFPRVSHYFTEGDGCFLVMELVHGDDLDKLLAQRAAPFDEKQVLSWADQILDALEDLHASGIIHRDLKPSNLKLTPKGRIKLLDFGIAKGALEGDATVLTTVGSMAAATLQYAPLEQVLKASPQYQMMLSVVSADKVSEIMRQGTDASSDLYALAATVYQLLTKQLPADAPTRALAVWSGQHDRLVPASEINPQISKAVTDVLQKALAINRFERYQSAAEMRRILNDAANPVTIAPTVFAAPETETGVGSSTVEPVKPPTLPAAKPETERFATQVTQLRNAPVTPKKTDPHFNKSTKKILFYAVAFGFPLLLVFAIANLGRFSPRNDNANRVPASQTSNYDSASSNSAADVKSNSATPAAGVEYVLAETLPEQNEQISSLVFSPDGKTFASLVWQDKTIKLWDAESGNLKLSINADSEGLTEIAFSPDGKTIAGGGYDYKIKFWDAASGKLKLSITENEYRASNLTFSPDGKTLVSTRGYGIIKLHDAATGRLKLEFRGHQNAGNMIAYSPDGSFFATTGSRDVIRLWSAADGKLIRTIDTTPFKMFCFSPDGKRIATDSTFDINLWDPADGSLKQTLKDAGANFAAFSPDGKLLASAQDYDSENGIRILDIARGELVQTLKGHSKSVKTAAFSPDGKTLVSGSLDKTVKIWRLK